jgi:hypothetical protein
MAQFTASRRQAEYVDMLGAIKKTKDEPLRSFFEQAKMKYILTNQTIPSA